MVNCADTKMGMHKQLACTSNGQTRNGHAKQWADKQWACTSNGQTETVIIYKQWAGRNNGQMQAMGRYK